MPHVYIAYPSSLSLRSANAVQTYHTVSQLRAIDPALIVLIPRLVGRQSAYGAVGAVHLPRLPFNVLNHVVRTTLWSYLERTWFAWATAVWLATRRHVGPCTVVYIRDAVGAAWYGLLLRRLLGIRLIYEVHDLEQWNPSRARSRAMTPLVRVIDAAALRGSDRVVTLTAQFRAYLARVGLKHADEVAVIPDAYDAAVYQPGDRAAARGVLELPHDAFVAVYSGFTFAYRRLDLLVAAWTTVCRHHPSALLCLVGGRPSEIAALRAEADARGLQERIRFAGVQAPSVVATYLAAADVLAIPGAVSGLNASPLKMFEYMAMRRPIVSIDLGSLREILGDDGALFVPAGDCDRLATALLTLAGHPPTAERLAEWAGQRAAAFTYAARARAVLRVMKQAAATANDCRSPQRGQP